MDGWSTLSPGCRTEDGLAKTFLIHSSGRDQRRREKAGS
jgi:hypothetical protein